MKQYRTIELRPVKLSPEVVAAREEERKRRRSMTSEDFMKEKQRQHSEIFRRNGKNVSKKEVIWTYAVIFGLILSPAIISQIIQWLS